MRITRITVEFVYSITANGIHIMNSTLATTWSPPVSPALGGSPPATVALHDWPMQVPCVVHGFVPSTESDNLRTQRRLAELGFLPGERVCIVARGWLRRWLRTESGTIELD